MIKEKDNILDLISRIKLYGDNDAFIELNEIYKNLCYNIARSIYIYEDFEQDKNSTMMDAIRKYDPEKCVFGTYLANQIKFLCYNKRNKLKVTPQLFPSGLLIDQLDNSASQDMLYDKNIEYCHDYETNESMKIVIDKVNNLDEEEKRLFALRYYDGLSWREIGKELKMSGQACLNWHNRVVKQIRKDIPELVD